MSGFITATAAAYSSIGGFALNRLPFMHTSMEPGWKDISQGALQKAPEEYPFSRAACIQL
ncbi:MAG TPA: hypothetical protein DCZ40_12110 [Lachnospiraceae bacterium]|nr:hypothetical protein [Lachnospiraceae bacterium]